MQTILFASSEAHPLAKTGGLADVSASLPLALRQTGIDVQLILPGYRHTLEQLDSYHEVTAFRVHGSSEPVRLLRTTFPASDLPLWLVAHDGMFNRDAGLYQGPDGNDWSDNDQRFALFCRAVVELATGRAVSGWQADLVHCHDWQTGLIPALLSLETAPPATLFTIHNLAYQGLFPLDRLGPLGLPPHFGQLESLEFHGHLSFIKGGLVYADQITTVSPTYAREICTPAFGYGLEGLLEHRKDALTGILNGIDYDYWNPAHDPLIAQPYDAQSLKQKRINKRSVQRHFHLSETVDTPLLAFVGRMVDQKGIDLILDALPLLLSHNIQCVILGSGDPRFEHAFNELHSHYHERLGVYIGYNEGLAHQIEAGADIFLMPSRFEPCGLNQLYSLRYGTVPVVRRTGGLADTVVDADETARKAGTATGFVFDQANRDALLEATERALALYPRPRLWRALQASGMRKDFSWAHSAQLYIGLYQALA